ncbi:hypothetical protein [Serratia fonticola]|uniref:hypothetical protein n=1 Tax=Serratia fonticola TaxID=47917 RepID=UPI000E0F3E77|nr:hypothetical protein [Serratia fonticola]RDL15608.1 hypothetical protein DFO62_12318 [Serratia fonticola]
MKLAPETRKTLRHYKTVVNERRKQEGRSLLNTEQIIDEICDYITHQCAAYIGGVYILQSGKDNEK